MNPAALSALLTLARALNPKTSARLRVDGSGLDFDRDYGIDRRTGWSAILDGSVVVQFVTLDEAIEALLYGGPVNVNPAAQVDEPVFASDPAEPWEATWLPLDAPTPNWTPIDIPTAFEFNYTNKGGPKMRAEMDGKRVALTVTEPDGTRREWVSKDGGETWAGLVRVSTLNIMEDL